MKKKINCNWHKYVDLGLNHQTMKLKINCNWHRYVDLGLPSGVLWATCNVGASEPWESGLYFSWGNVEGHKNGSIYDFSATEYASTPGVKLTTDIPADAEYDAARANFGGSWRIPTTAEFKELHDNCTSVWTMQNGIDGRRFTSRINGNSVFFPAAGFYYDTSFNYNGTYGGYLSSSLNSQTYAYGLFFGSGYVYPQDYSSRFIGYPVRAVLDHPENSLMIKAIKR